jgi:hypothetical protein
VPVQQVCEQKLILKAGYYYFIFAFRDENSPSQTALSQDERYNIPLVCLIDFIIDVELSSLQKLYMGPKVNQNLVQYPLKQRPILP